MLDTNTYYARNWSGAPPTEVGSNADILGVSQAASDAAIASGQTSAGDAAWYAAKYTGYEAWNFLTAGFVQRHDARIAARSAGQLNDTNFYTATTLDAVGSVASLYVGGRVGGFVAGRLGSGYAGYIGSGEAGGTAFDLVQQGTGLGINALTGGQTGQEAFSWGELTGAATSGAALGGAFKFVSDVPALNVPYALQSPIVLDTTPGMLYSSVFGVPPFNLRNPLVRVGPTSSPNTAWPSNSPFYEVGFEANLTAGVHYPGMSARSHFAEANRQLYQVMQNDPIYAQRLEAMYPGITVGVAPGARGAFPRGAPTADLTWHHDYYNPGVLQLMLRSQHTAPGPVQLTMHPNQQGGMEVWGGGR